MKISSNDIKNIPFTLKQIKYFVAVAEYKQVTVAAKYIFISPSVITSSIKDLEEHLQVKLFIRKNDGLQLTREGDIFLNHCYNILSAVSSADSATKNLSFHDEKLLTGQLRIGCTETISGYFLTDILTSFKQMFPNIQLSFKEYSRCNLEKSLIKNHVDIALILTDNLQNKDEINYEIILQSPRTLWVAENNKFLHMDTVTLEDIVKEPFIQLTIDEAQKATLRWWGSFNLKPNIIFETSSVESVRSLVSSGHGITILSNMVYRSWSLEGRRIERVLLNPPAKKMNIGLAWLNNIAQSKEVKEFMIFCRKRAINHQHR